MKLYVCITEVYEAGATADVSHDVNYNYWHAYRHIINLIRSTCVYPYYNTSVTMAHVLTQRGSHLMETNLLEMLELQKKSK